MDPLDPIASFALAYHMDSCYSVHLSTNRNCRISGFPPRIRILEDVGYALLRSPHPLKITICRVLHVKLSYCCNAVSVSVPLPLGNTTRHAIDNETRLGVRGEAHDWIASYLCGRSQRVEISFVDSQGILRRKCSNDLVIKMGVPQGVEGEYLRVQRYACESTGDGIVIVECRLFVPVPSCPVLSMNRSNKSEPARRTSALGYANWGNAVHFISGSLDFT
ncbi:hypothetical protein J6590_073871 [Homalodisca vitripennis]|nr:hypothetical protein J6590_073871 [Homalodisca vitripennis]